METSLFRYVWQKSRAEQIIVLLIILVSIPFNWASFDVPKRIVNDAIQGGAFRDGRTSVTVFDWTLHLPEFLGGGSFQLFDGFQVSQYGLLLTLSLYFLVLVLINGGFKYAINVRKGILGERMLRRMRYDLFAQLMRFRPEDIRAAKPAEVASMIKDEVEPIGAFVGDAFIQPAFLLSQALTALVFIMMQSVWLGSIALLIVLMQAVIIPILRREQLRLGRERQIASRQLAGRIGEIVDAGPTIQGHGAASYVQSDIAGRLGTLFDIRYALYKRKFAVKFLNNLLAQITPFFFYAIGGFFALQGRLDIGQLVAVIAAYRDLPPPVKELIDWDQQRNDVMIKYEQVIAQFNPRETLELEEKDGVASLPKQGEIELDKVEMSDNRGQPLLLPLSFAIPRPSCVALIGPAGSGRDTLARILGRQSMGYEGRVLIDGHPLSSFSVESASHLIGYAGPDTEIINGRLRDNVLLPLKRRRPSIPDRAIDPAEHRRFIEALRAGNTPLPFSADWNDYEGVGLDGAEALEAHVLAVLEMLGCSEEIYELGLDAKVNAPLPEGAAERIIEARQVVSAELAKSNLGGLIETFDPERYNANATIAENLVFGAVRNGRRPAELLLDDPYARSVLQAEALEEPLAEIGTRIVNTLFEIFAGMAHGQTLFARYGFDGDLDLEKLNELAEALRRHDMRGPLDPMTQREVMGLALRYIEPKHRLNLLDGALQRRILRARQTFKTYLPPESSEEVEFYDPDDVIHGASVRDNLFFGRLGFGADAGEKVAEIVRSALTRAGLDAAAYRLGLDTDVGPRGRHLPLRLRLMVPLAQALIKRPDILVLDLDGFLAVSNDPATLVSRIVAHCREQTLFVLLTDPQLAADISEKVVFRGPAGLVPGADEAESEGDEDTALPPVDGAERIEART
ncbi:ABC transporter ATP-binding protein/permease [Bosea rubneri]|uniref:ABC transporter ATP-binding protein/permease n=1 Tax=Bosea rubneri TaxID=3075434 RepID=A0ABU3S740_9HYPH|nr:ABC transporter ATP-binding protein/permease [Bosea sp. ZW T0_25]MDU0340610.1 ABC transporter ATP-binding protein/permease [Bosea sp. ZW T0_25]